MIKAKLADGRVLQFPDGTSDEVIDNAVKKMVGGGTPELPTSPTPSAPAVDPSIRALDQMSPGTREPQPGEGPSSTFVEGVVREAPQVGGGIATAIAGAPLIAKATAAGTVSGGPIVGAGAGLLTAAGLVAIGAGGGEAYKQIGQYLSGSLNAPKTAIDAAKRIAAAGAEEGAWELVGGLAAKGFGKIISPFKDKLVEGSSEVINMFKDKIKPVVLLPAESTESRVMDLLQNVSEASIIGGNSIQAYKVKRLKFFDDFADSLIREFGERTDPTDLGNLFVAAVRDTNKTHNKAARVLYNSVKAGKVRIPTKSMQNFSRPLQKRARTLEGIEAKNAGDDLVDAVMSLGDDLSYKEAVELRSRLISRIDEFSILNKKAPAIGKAKKLVGLLDGAIGKSLKGYPRLVGLVVERSTEGQYREKLRR